MIGPALVASPDVAAVTFTGSTPVGRAIAADAAALGKRAQCEMGGRNALIVMEDADFEPAMEAVLLAGFGTSGQRCTSASRVILQHEIAEQFTEALVHRVQALRVGQGLDEAVEVGPLVSATQLRNVQEALSRAQGEGAEMLCGGEVLDGGDFEHGHFMQPAVLRCAPDSWFTNHETFGPVVSVYEAGDFDKAVRLTTLCRTGCPLPSTPAIWNMRCASFARQIPAWCTSTDQPLARRHTYPSVAPRTPRSGPPSWAAPLSSSPSTAPRT